MPLRRRQSKTHFLEWKCTNFDKNFNEVPDSKFYGANVVPIWGRQDPGGPHVGPMNLAIWGVFQAVQLTSSIGSDDGLLPTRRQTIIWTNDG